MSTEAHEESFEAEEAPFDFQYYEKQFKWSRARLFLRGVGTALLVTSSVCLMTWALFAFANEGMRR